MRTFFLFTLLSFTLHSQAQEFDLSTLSTSNPDTFNLPWPPYVFEHWVWEDESTQESALTIVDDYISRGIPVSAIIIDSPWETGYNTFEWDTTLFANAQSMIDSLHARDVKVLLWITGIVNTDVQPMYDYAKDQGYFMKQTQFDNNPGVVDWWKGEGSLIDWFNPDAVTWWKGLMDNMLDMGIDGWKCDGTDFSVITTPYSPGDGGYHFNRTDYSHAYYQIHFDYTREVLGDDRVIHARPVDNYGSETGTDIGGAQAAFSPVETSFAAWVGDQDGTFEGMVWALNSMYHSFDMGYFSFGSDIGGYRDDDNYPTLGRSKELFIRWAQLGTFCGLMENGGGGEHRPWMFDQETEDIYKDLVEKRYLLVPYLMDNSGEYFDNQLSLMQFFNKTDYSYMLGPDIFVAPFLEEGTSITVNFPAGNEWIYLYNSSQVYTGGITETLTIPYTEYPVFIKGESLSINELTEAQVAVYPNPADNQLNIKLIETGRANSSIELFDMTGKLVYSENFNISVISVDISDLPEGVYQCRITVDGKTANRKVVKQ